MLAMMRVQPEIHWELRWSAEAGECIFPPWSWWNNDDFVVHRSAGNTKPIQYFVLEGNEKSSTNERHEGSRREPHQEGFFPDLRAGRGLGSSFYQDIGSSREVESAGAIARSRCWWPDHARRWPRVPCWVRRDCGRHSWRGTSRCQPRAATFPSRRRFAPWPRRGSG